MLAAPRPEPVREAEEVRLVDGVEHLDSGALDDFVLQRGTPSGRCRPSSFEMYTRRNGFARYAPRFSRSAGRGGVLQRRRSAATSRHRRPARLSLQGEIRSPQSVDVVDVVQERGEPRLPVSSCCLTYTLERTERAVRLVSGARFAGAGFLGQTASLHPSATGCPALFGDFTGTAGLSDFPVRSSSASSLDFPTRPARQPRRATRDLPVSREVSVHARGV